MSFKAQHSQYFLLGRCVLLLIPCLDLSGAIASLRHQNGAYGRAEVEEREIAPLRHSTWIATTKSQSSLLPTPSFMSP